MTNAIQTLRQGAILLTLVAVTGLASARGVPGDGAIPVVELMPLTMKHEADLKLSAEQIKSLGAAVVAGVPLIVRSFTVTDLPAP